MNQLSLLSKLKYTSKYFVFTSNNVFKYYITYKSNSVSCVNVHQSFSFIYLIKKIVLNIFFQIAFLFLIK